MFDSIVDRAEGSDGSRGVGPFMNHPEGLILNAMLFAPPWRVKFPSRSCSSSREELKVKAVPLRVPSIRMDSPVISPSAGSEPASAPSSLIFWITIRTRVKLTPPVTVSACPTDAERAVSETVALDPHPATSSARAIVFRAFRMLCMIFPFVELPRPVCNPCSETEVAILWGELDSPLQRHPRQ